MTATDWDRRFMDLAEYVAEWSKECGVHVGSVIVGPDREVRSTGYNGMPRGVNEDVDERHSRVNNAKNLWSAHAEINAICNAVRMGVSVKGCTIYVPWFPCVDCGKAIIQSGITRLVAYRPDFDDPKWGLHFEIVRTMCEESGISITFLDGEDVKARYERSKVEEA